MTYYFKILEEGLWSPLSWVFCSVSRGYNQDVGQTAFLPEGSTLEESICKLIQVIGRIIFLSGFHPEAAFRSYRLCIFPCHAIHIYHQTHSLSKNGAQLINCLQPCEIYTNIKPSHVQTTDSQILYSFYSDKSFESWIMVTWSMELVTSMVTSCVVTSCVVTSTMQRVGILV